MMFNSEVYRENLMNCMYKHLYLMAYVSDWYELILYITELFPQSLSAWSNLGSFSSFTLRYFVQKYRMIR